MFVLFFSCSFWLQEQTWEWNLPEHFPEPPVPQDNPMHVRKVELGRHLFYDTRLSINASYSCASCHKQELSFTDGLAKSLGATGERHPRSAMSLANVVYTPRLTWANAMLERLEHHAMNPLFGTEHLEMGMEGKEDVIISMYEEDETMAELFRHAFPKEEEPISIETITKAIAAFQRSLISTNSPYDRFLEGDKAAMSASAQRGMELFFSERLECFHCHAGFNFSDSVNHEGKALAEFAFHNNGLYSLDEKGAYPKGNEGLFDLTHEDGDRGRFRAPSLRNITVTAPYMHDGSIATLGEVLDMYADGGRNITEGDFRGDGRTNPNKSEFVNRFILEEEEKKDVLAFLEALTDNDFLHDPKFAAP